MNDILWRFTTECLVLPSIWPKELSWPKYTDISGVSLGLPSSYGLPLVTGADLSMMWGNSQNVHGFKAALICTGNKMNGLQVAIFNRAEDFKGGEFGIINMAYNCRGTQLGIYNECDTNIGSDAQLGIVNVARRSDCGIQIGIINIMKNGFLPVFPFFNFPIE